MTPKIDTIPKELKKRPQWVCFNHEKEPINPRTGGDAKADDPATWGDIAQAVKHWEAHKENGIAGIGYEFSYYDPYCGVDLDKCRDPENGEIEPWAAAIIERLNSYTEISPSGTGLHILVKGKLPTGGRKKEVQKELNAKDGIKRVFETYDVGRYFTMTGAHIPGTPATIQDRQAELTALHTEIFGKPQAQQKNTPPAAALDLSDQELIDKARNATNGSKFIALYDRGDVSGHNTPSDADFALCAILAFWTGKDYARIERLFNSSALGQRDKWQDREDYRRRTIETAISKTTETYDPGKSKRKETRQTTEEKDPQTPEDFRGLRLTDMGNAERLIALHGKDLRYCFPWEKWLVWDKNRWSIDVSGEVKRRGKDVVAALYAAAAEAQDKTERTALAQFGLRCEAHNKQNSFILSAQSELPVEPDNLDRDPWLFNVQNGTVNLQTGDLRPHDRGNLITKLAPVNHDLNAECPLWWEFLTRIFNGNMALIRFLQKAVGYALTGSTQEQCLFFLYGLGANGKSTLLEVLQTLLGDYSKRTSTETFLIKKSGGIPNDVAALRGARFVSAVEVESGRRLAEVLVKEMTGGDIISARFMWAEWFEFKPEFKIFLAANHKPTIRGTDHAIWRRIHLLPFTVQIPKEERDPRLAEKLKAELPGILTWALEGCLLWQSEGLEPPQEVQAATQEYREEMDPLGDFLAESCVVGPKISGKATALYNAFRKWAEDSGETRPMSQTSFGTSLRERGFEKEKTRTGIIWWGIGLRE